MFDTRDALLFESLHRVAALPCDAALRLLAHLQPPVLRDASVRTVVPPGPLEL